MSEKTRSEVMAKLRMRYAKARNEYRRELIDQAVEIMGFHRKSAIRSLNAPKKTRGDKGVKAGRPPRYDSQLLSEPLKAIWLSGQQPCGKRLMAMMKDWVRAYEAYRNLFSPNMKLKEKSHPLKGEKDANTAKR